MLCNVCEDSMGNIHIEPVSLAKSIKIRKELKEIGMARKGALILFLEGAGGEELLTKETQKMIGKGYTCRARIPDETIYNLVGLG